MELEEVLRTMRIGNLPDFLEEELAYPIDRASVVDQIGAVEVDAPDREDTETIAAILGSLGPETYDSADELYRTIVGNVGEEHIGRKFYDDRGQNSVDSSEGPSEERDVSF